MAHQQSNNIAKLLVGLGQGGGAEPDIGIQALCIKPLERTEPFQSRASGSNRDVRGELPGPRPAADEHTEKDKDTGRHAAMPSRINHGIGGR